MANKIPYIIIIALITVGTLHYYFQPVQSNDGLIHCTATVTSIPKLAKSSQSFKADCTTGPKGLSLRAAKYPSLQVGERIEVTGTLTANQLFFPEIKKLSTTNPNLLFSFRHRLESNIKAALPASDANLVVGMLLGTSESFSDNISTAFKRTGTLHMIVVSGFNVSLIATTILKLAGLIHRRIAVILSLCAVVVFVLLTGAEPPAIRAGIMAGLILVAQFWGRPSSSFFSLLFAASIMFALSPEIVTSLSFQLSVLATAGVLLFTTIIEKKLQLLSTQLHLKSLSHLTTELSTTLAAQLAVIPILLLSFNQLSLISPLANLAVGWTVPYIMSFGLLIGVGGLIHPLVAKLFSFLTYPFTAYFLQSISLFSKIPYVVLDNVNINPSIASGIYLVLVYIIIKNREDINYSKSQE